MKIIGNTVGTTTPRPNWEQNDPTKADYIRNKPDIPKGVHIGSGEMPEDCNVQIDPEGEVLNVDNELKYDEYGDLSNGDKIASIKCVHDVIDFMAKEFGEEIELKADKSYVDNLFNSIINGNEVSY